MTAVPDIDPRGAPPPRAPQRPPAQPPLPDVAAGFAAARPRIAITGRLRQPAELRFSPSGEHVHLVVTLAQPPHRGRPGLPIIATRSGTADSIASLEALALRMRVGERVRVVGAGLAFDWDRNALKLLECESVEEEKGVV